jgi:hypothetical protein
VSEEKEIKVENELVVNPANTPIKPSIKQTRAEEKKDEQPKK